MSREKASKWFEKKKRERERGIRCCWAVEGRGERFVRRGTGELSICTNLRICHVSGRVFFAAALRWF